ncbi:MAG: hypothetical protein NT177_07190 [Chloroflexi bacterium]|nr:hypothetical protein [Chloroflexota bacterium]
MAGCSAPAPAPVAPQEPAVTSPKLGVNSLTLDLRFAEGDSKTVTKNITFMNEGEGVMVWAVRKSVPWMWMNEADGVLEKGYSKNLEIFIAPAGKEPGTYTDNITIEGAGARSSPQTVVVTMVITPAPPAPGSDAAAAAAKKPVPAPPWDYTEYYDTNYNFRLRYPKDYQKKQLMDSTFGAEASANSPQANSIRINIVSGLGVDYNAATLEWAKAIRMSGGGSSPKVISSDNATTLLDGVTPAFEFLYDAKSSTKQSSQVYIYGVKKGSRYIMFGGVAPSAIAPDRLQLWKEIAHTLEFVDNDLTGSASRS